MPVNGLLGEFGIAYSLDPCILYNVQWLYYIVHYIRVHYIPYFMYCNPQKTPQFPSVGSSMQQNKMKKEFWSNL